MTKVRICSRCVMDETVPDITFDNDGICNLCTDAVLKIKSEVFTGEEGQTKINELVNKISRSTSKKYNCIIGVSGGVDSSYVAYLAKDLG